MMACESEKKKKGSSWCEPVLTCQLFKKNWLSILQMMMMIIVNDWTEDDDRESPKDTVYSPVVIVAIRSLFVRSGRFVGIYEKKQKNNKN